MSAYPEVVAGERVLVVTLVHGVAASLEDPASITSHHVAPDGTWSDGVVPVKLHTLIGVYGETVDTTGLASGVWQIVHIALLTTGESQAIVHQLSVRAQGTEHLHSDIASVASDVTDIGGDVDDANMELVDLQARTPAALVGGRMDASVGAMEPDVVTPAAVATGAVDADALATDAVTEIGIGVWAHSPRTLTQTALAVVAAVTGGVITLKRGDTFSATLTGLGSLVGRTKFWFTVKTNSIYPDTAAIILIREGDGLIYLNGMSAPPTQGSLVVNDPVDGDVTITLAAAAAAQLPVGSHSYDIQVLTPAGVTTLSGGALVISEDITRATS